MLRNFVANTKSALTKARPMIFTSHILEGKVISAIDDSTSGPHGGTLRDLAGATFRPECCQAVMTTLWNNLVDTKLSAKCTHKCLILLQYLLRNGAEAVVFFTLQRVADINTLEHYHPLREEDLEVAQMVRLSGQNTMDLLLDRQKLQHERRVASACRGRFVGFGSARTKSEDTTSRSSRNHLSEIEDWDESHDIAAEVKGHVSNLWDSLKSRTPLSYQRPGEGEEDDEEDDVSEMGRSGPQPRETDRLSHSQ